MIFSLAAGSALLITAVLGVWQHNVTMEKMMGGMGVWQHNIMMERMMGGATNMMVWITLPLIIAAATLIILPVTLYLLGMGQTGGIAGLTDEEKAVVDYLTRSGGMSEQREIARALGLSRLKTHRLISSLRRREVVTVEPRGRTNLVKLKNNIQKAN